MIPVTARAGLSLKKAIVEYCDPVFIGRVRIWERLQTTQELRDAELLFSDELQKRSDEYKGPSWDEYQSHTYREWRKTLEKNFRQRIIDGVFVLYGIQTKPTRMTERSLIPGAWAADCRFNFRDDVLWVDKFVFHDVAALPAPLANPASAPQAPSSVSTITQEGVQHLTDEEVLLLLEDHARRVVEHPDAKLVEPGKISLMPIIRRKMLHRAEGSLTRETLAAEAAELAEWIATKVPSHHVPQASTIANVLRSEYRSLGPRSKAIMP